MEKKGSDMNKSGNTTGRSRTSGASGFSKGSGKGAGKPYGQKRKTGGAAAGKPYYLTKLEGRTGARPGDYVIISDGKQKVTTRVNLANHPFCKKKVGDVVTIKAIQWTLVRILYQGSEAYHKVYDADTQREHYGY